MSSRKWCSQAVPETQCWHQKMASCKEIILTWFSLGGFTAFWGVLRLMPCLAYHFGGFHFKKASQGERNKDSSSCLLLSPPPFACKGGRVGTCHRQPGEHPAAAHAASIPRRLREHGWFLWAQLDTESSFQLRSPTGNITTNLRDLSSHCSWNQGWYENMKINNSFILLFSRRQPFLFITHFILGCHKYSRIIIPG